MKTFLRNLGGMVAAPRATLRHLVAGGEGDWFDVVLLLAAVRLFLSAPVLYRQALLLPEAPLGVANRLVRHAFEGIRSDLLALAIGAAVFSLYAHYLSPHRATFRAAITAVAWTAIPLALLEAFSGALAHLGLHGWWMPHVPADSLWAIVVDGRISWARYAAKCAINYAIPLGLLLWLAHILWHEAPPAEKPPAPGQGPARLGLGLAGVALLGLAVGGTFEVIEKRDQLRPLLPGDALPAASLPYLSARPTDEKGRLSFADLKGKVVVLDFWASWCPPCRKEMPELSEIQRDLGPRGLQIVGINREPGDREAARQGLLELDPAFPSVIDTRAGTLGGYGEKIGLQSLPTTVVVDREGVVRHLHLGYTMGSTIRAEVEALLAQ